jgi:hypothetical protein
MPLQHKVAFLIFLPLVSEELQSIDSLEQLSSRKHVLEIRELELPCELICWVPKLPKISRRLLKRTLRLMLRNGKQVSQTLTSILNANWTFSIPLWRQTRLSITWSPKDRQFKELQVVR